MAAPMARTLRKIHKQLFTETTRRGSLIAALKKKLPKIDTSNLWPQSQEGKEVNLAKNK